MAAAALVGLGVAPQAAAASGQVVAFASEFVPTRTWHNPSGCHQLPLGAHVIVDNTDTPIRVYADPLCVIPTEPFATIQAGYGTHVSAAGQLVSYLTMCIQY